MSDRSKPARVLVGDSVWEDATLTTSGGYLHIEFEADDLGPLAIPLEAFDGLTAPHPDYSATELREIGYIG